jgi:hypothetical protein
LKQQYLQYMVAVVVVTKYNGMGMTSKIKIYKVRALACMTETVPKNWHHNDKMEQNQSDDCRISRDNECDYYKLVALLLYSVL